MKTQRLMTRIAPLLVLAIAAFAVAACGGDEGAGVSSPTPAASASPSATTGPDQPVSATPGGPSVTPTTAPALPSDRRAEPAPIDALDISVAESFPPQYFLHVQAGLPSGCARQYRHEVSRAGEVITVTVLNSIPADPTTICTAIYGMYELNLNLGSDFDPGVTYKVMVNDKETSFTAQ